MKKQILTVCVMLLLIINASGQTIDLTFTAVDNESYVQLESIKVMNRTQGGDTVLYWPDTVLSLIVVGLDELQVKENAFQVFQNYPNPVVDQTTISFYIPSKDQVGFMVTDMLGRAIVKGNRILDKGIHSYRFTPGEGNLYFFKVQWRDNSSSIKILQNTNHSGGQGTLEYLGSDASTIEMKEIAAFQNFNFNIGDELLYIGYTNGLQSGILDSPVASETFTFQFATNIPCPGTTTVEYEGQVYNTIQVFSQCWIKENLNVGTMIPGTQNMTDNGVIEKYCYDNLETNCDKWGGLYQRDEMMQYAYTLPAQGMCPPGWHLPTDEEWKVLEGAVDSLYSIGNPEWDIPGQYRGYDAGTNLKTTSGWYENGNGTDLFGFSGLPGGFRYYYGGFVPTYNGYWWSSGEDYIDTWYRVLLYDLPEVLRSNSASPLGVGFSVRCLRD